MENNEVKELDIVNDTQATLSDLDIPKEDLKAMIHQGNDLISLIRDTRFNRVIKAGYLENYYADVRATYERAVEVAKTGDEEAEYVQKQLFNRLEAIKQFHIYLDEVLSLRKFALERLGKDE